MQIFDTQMKEMQRGSENQCRQIFSRAMPFSEPVRTYHYHRRAYQGLLNVGMVQANVGHKVMPLTSS